MHTKPLITLANEKQFDVLEEAWMEALAVSPPPVEEMMHVVEWLIKSKEAARGEVLLDTLVEALAEHSCVSETLAVAFKSMHLFPKNAGFRAAYGKALCATHPDNPALPGIVAKSGLTSGGPLAACLTDIEHKRSIRTGAFALHRRRRIPVRIEAYDPNADAVTLTDGAEAFAASLPTFLDQYEPLDAHDFRVLKTFNKDVLAEMAESDPEHLVISYLKNSGRQSTFRDFRDTLSSCAVAPDDWKGWWARVKTLLVKNPMINLGEGGQPALTLRDSPRNFSENVIRDFDFADMPRMKPAMVIHYLKEVQTGSPLSEDVIAHFTAQLGAMISSRESDTLAFASWLALALIAQDLNRPAPAYCSAWISTAEACAEFGHWCSWDPLYVAPSIKLVPVADSGWPAIFAGILPTAPMAMVEQLAGALSAGGHQAPLQDAVRHLADPVVANAEAYGWMWRLLATDELQGIAFPVDLRTATMGMFKLVRQLTTTQDTIAHNVHESLAVLRHTLSTKKYDVIKSVFLKLGPEHAVTLYQTIQGNTGLSTPMRSQMVHILSRSGSIGGKAA